MQRVLEAMIIGAGTALASSYITVRILDEKIQTISRDVDAINARELRHYETTQESIRQIYAILVEKRR